MSADQRSPKKQQPKGRTGSQAKRKPAHKPLQKSAPGRDSEQAPKPTQVRTPEKSSAAVRILFPKSAPDCIEALEGYEKVLDRTSPLKPKHRRMLPGAVKSLSITLTEDRDKLKSDYLSAPGPLNAYLRYFLPWNLIRLARLFAGLGPETGLGLGPDSIVADLGSGPLTAVQALWMAAPNLRDVPMTFVCVDRTPQAMRRGLALFDSLSGSGRSPWKIKLVNGSLVERISGGADLVICANALNEYVRQTRKPEPVQASLLAQTLTQRLRPGGRLLCIEPGVRNAARLLVLLREQLLENGLSIHAPCPHHEECPMPGEAGTPWCHFAFPVQDAPDWLKNLSREAGLDKVRAGLSFILAGSDPIETPDRAVRIISDEFPVPTRNCVGRYGCSRHGLTLVTLPGKGKINLYPGQLLTPEWPASPDRDQKSGAVILPLGDAEPARKGKTKAPFSQSDGNDQAERSPRPSKPKPTTDKKSRSTQKPFSRKTSATPKPGYKQKSDSTKKPVRSNKASSDSGKRSKPGPKREK